MPSLRSYRRVRSNLGPSPLRNTRFGKLIRSPLFRRASYFASAAQAAGIARRVYANYKRKRRAASYVEQPFSKKRKMPPTTTGSRVTSKYKLAPYVTKFNKAKVSKQKPPKSAMVHYKEFGEFNAEKCMYVNHEHWGQQSKFWLGISYGLTKLLLAQGKIYNGKSMEDPVIGPRSNALDPLYQYDDKTGGTLIRLIFSTENSVGDGGVTRSTLDIEVEDTTATPDVYKSFDQIATEISNSLQLKYSQNDKTWLTAAALYVIDTTSGIENATPFFMQNLDDAEINLWVKSLIKFQNITQSDTGSYDKHSIDANPLIGRSYTAKGYYPNVDNDLMSMGDKTLDSFFGDVRNANTGGLTMLGALGAHTADDIGRIAHIPPPKELYGNQTVKSGPLHMSAGSQKFHTTSFTFKHTFRSLAKFGFAAGGNAHNKEIVSRHTLFGFTQQHRHGDDTIKIGFNRDVTVGCFIKYKRAVYPIKTNFTKDAGTITTLIVPTDHT